MRRPVVAGNWKMNMLIADAIQFMDRLIPELAPVPGAEIILAPPFTALAAASEKLSGAPVFLAGQNMAEHSQGAYTGEIGASMLEDAGCAYVIIGHSERRVLFAEDDALVHRKCLAALKQGLRVILCVGETREQRRDGQTENVVGRQILSALAGLCAESLQNIVIAYEPIWAIGTGDNASPEQAQEVHAFMRARLSEMFDRSSADSMRLLYGGSVNESNCTGLFGMPDIDGVLVGSASLNVKSFCAIINAAEVRLKPRDL